MEKVKALAIGVREYLDDNGKVDEGSMFDEVWKNDGYDILASDFLREDYGGCGKVFQLYETEQIFQAINETVASYDISKMPEEIRMIIRELAVNLKGKFEK